MSDVALPGSIEPAARKGPDLSGAINPLTAILFGGVLAAMVLYVAYSIYSDIGESGLPFRRDAAPQNAGHSSDQSGSRDAALHSSEEIEQAPDAGGCCRRSPRF